MWILARVPRPKRAKRAWIFLAPIAINRRLIELTTTKWQVLSVGDRSAPRQLLDLLRQIDPAKVKGTLTVAFVVQQWTGARGLHAY